MFSYESFVCCLFDGGCFDCWVVCCWRLACDWFRWGILVLLICVYYMVAWVCVVGWFCNFLLMLAFNWFGCWVLFVMFAFVCFDCLLFIYFVCLWVFDCFIGLSCWGVVLVACWFVGWVWFGRWLVTLCLCLGWLVVWVVSFTVCFRCCLILWGVCVLFTCLPFYFGLGCWSLCCFVDCFGFGFAWDCVWWLIWVLFCVVWFVVYIGWFDCLPLLFICYWCGFGCLFVVLGWLRSCWVCYILWWFVCVFVFGCLFAGVLFLVWLAALFTCYLALCLVAMVFGFAA